MIKWKGLDFFFNFRKKKSKIFENFDTIPRKKLCDLIWSKRMNSNL